MNLRILKKLSKRAAPLLILLGDEREQFRSERGEWHDMPFIGDRKHWHRTSCRQDHEPSNDWCGIPRAREIKFTTRKGVTMLMRPPRAPHKGTVMVGSMCGGEQPEWEDETAWCALQTLVLNHFIPAACFAAWDRWDGEGEPPEWNLDRSLKTPREIFQGADEMLREQESVDGGRRPAF